MDCPRCGRELAESFAFCTWCGAPSTQSSPQPTPMAAADAKGPSAIATDLYPIPPPVGRKRWLWIVIVVGIVITAVTLSALFIVAYVIPPQIRVDGIHVTYDPCSGGLYVAPYRRMHVAIQLSNEGFQDGNVSFRVLIDQKPFQDDHVLLPARHLVVVAYDSLMHDCLSHSVDVSILRYQPA